MKLLCAVGSLVVLSIAFVIALIPASILIGIPVGFLVAVCILAFKSIGAVAGIIICGIALLVAAACSTGSPGGRNAADRLTSLCHELSGRSINFLFGLAGKGQKVRTSAHSQAATTRADRQSAPVLAKEMNAAKNQRLPMTKGRKTPMRVFVDGIQDQGQVLNTALRPTSRLVIVPQGVTTSPAE